MTVNFYKVLTDQEKKFVRVFCEIGESDGKKALATVFPGCVHPLQIMLKPQIVEAIEAASDGELSPSMRPLTINEERTIDTYIESGLDYKKTATILGVKVQSLRIKFAAPHMKYELSLRMEEAREMSMISARDIIEEYAETGFADITTYMKKGENGNLVLKDLSEMENTGAIAEISYGQYGLKLKLHSKPQALDALSKISGLFKERVEITGKNGEAIKMEVESPVDTLMRKITQMSKNDKASDAVVNALNDKKEGK